MEAFFHKPLQYMGDVTDEVENLMDIVSLDKLVNESAERSRMAQEEEWDEKYRSDRKRTRSVSFTEACEQSLKRRKIEMQEELHKMAEHEGEVFKDLCESSMRNDAKHLKYLANAKRLQKEILSALQSFED